MSGEGEIRVIPPGTWFILGIEGVGFGLIWIFQAITHLGKMSKMNRQMGLPPYSHCKWGWIPLTSGLVALATGATLLTSYWPKGL